MSKKKKKNIRNVRTTKAIDVANYIFIVIMFGIYPVVTHNAYFDILKTRYLFLVISVIVYIIFYVIAFFIDRTFDSFYEIEATQKEVKINEKKYTIPEIWLSIFALANIFSFIVSDNRKDALIGKSGRYMGLVTYLLISVMFFLLARRIKISLNVFVVLALSTSFGYIVAIFQRLGNDFMNYSEGVLNYAVNSYIATMGNINILSSFLSIIIPLFVTMFIFAKEKKYKIIAGIVTVVSGMMFIVCSSDSLYLGIVAALLFLYTIAIYKSRFKQFLLSMLLLATGNLIAATLNYTEMFNFSARKGVGKILSRIDFSVVILVLVLFIYIVFVFVEKKYGKKVFCIEKKKFIIISFLLILVCMVLICILGVAQKWSIFRFDYHWGTGRGYIWAKCIELFVDAPFINKLFGYGNDSIRLLLTSNYYDEMLEITHHVQNNAHNELIQYLVTLGIVGLIGYIGLFVSSFVLILKNSKGSVMAYMCLSAMVGYFTQAIVNVNQPLTTPFLFIFMAIGVGVARYNKK